MTTITQSNLPAEGAAEELAHAALSLARRFAAGATLWCASPRWPSHARHVAVEFVHPVIVGKRALPAVSVVGSDPIGDIRMLSRPGDVLLIVAPGEDAITAELLARAESWGLTTILLGAGTPPGHATGSSGSGADSRADFTAWLADVDPLQAARTGQFVLLYHLLWELTHVVFEHPGLLEPESETGEAGEAACITCSDEGRVAEVRRGSDSGTEVLVQGRVEVVDTSLVGNVSFGDLILVHAGVALTVLPLADVAASSEPA